MLPGKSYSNEANDKSGSEYEIDTSGGLTRRLLFVDLEYWDSSPARGLLC